MRCTSVASVNVAEWWPSHRDTCLMFIPSANSIDAHVWRNVWKATHGTPARIAAGCKTRRKMFSRRSRSPVGAENSSSSGPRCKRQSARATSVVNGMSRRV
jgi:hypothetical protein